MEENILVKIRDAEKRAEKMLSSAEGKRQAMIEDAQKRAVAMHAEASEDIMEKSNADLKRFYDTLKKRKEKIISDCEKKSRDLKKGAQKKMPKAVDFLFETFRAAITA